MPSFNELPTRDQIAVIEDVPALEDIRDEIDRAIARIEADLEFSGRDDEWYERARNALAYHKYVDTLIGRRLRDLRAAANKRSPPRVTRTRERTRWSAYTQAAFNGEIVDPETVPDELPALESALGLVLKQLNALKDDKDDEVLNYANDEWDQTFLARVATAQRRCGAAHQSLLRRAAKLRKQEKVAIQAQRDVSRPQAFVDAAREVLDRATFLAIWEIVDRRHPETVAA